MILCEPFHLALTHPIETAQGPISARAGILVTITDDKGVTGQGEASPLPGFSTENIDEVLHQLGIVAAAGIRLPTKPNQIDAWISSFSLVPSAAFGLGTALLDLLARQRKVPVANLLTRKPRPMVPIAHLVSNATQAFGAVMLGAETVKVKVGAGSLEADVQRVAEIRDAAGPDVAIRLDANGAWNEREARQALTQLKRFRIACIEEPVARCDLDAMARLRDLDIPIGADESVRSLDDLERVIAAGAADVIVIKPMLVGSPHASIALLERAFDAGLKAFLTTTIDGAIARRAILHLAASVRHRNLIACGLVTGRYLDTDLVATPALTGSHAEIPDGIGLGLEMADPQGVS